MRIEVIEQTRSPQGKLRLRFDDGTSLLVFPSVVADLSLYAGIELPEGAAESLRESAGAASARERAVRMISAAPMTRAELHHRLLQKGETPEHAEEAVRWLAELNLLDDAQVAAQIVHSAAAKGYGPGRVRQILYEKRVPKALWDQALEQLPAQDDAIDRFLQKRFQGRSPDRSEWRKAVDALLRRGHSWSDIRAAMDRYTPDETEE